MKHGFVLLLALLLQGCLSTSYYLMDGFSACDPQEVQMNEQMHRAIYHIPTGALQDEVLAYFGPPQHALRYGTSYGAEIDGWVYKSGSSRCLHPKGTTVPIFFEHSRVIGTGWDYYQAAIQPIQVYQTTLK